MTHRNPHKTAQIGRSWLFGNKPEPPRVTMDCAVCHQPAEKLNVTASGLFVCDECVARIKKTGNERE